MVRKSKSSVVSTPATLDEQAVALHDRIVKKEDLCAPDYLEFGRVLSEMQTERGCTTKELIEHCKTLGKGIAESYVARARAIFTEYKDHPQDLNGLSLYAATGQKRNRSPTPNSPLKPP